MSLLENAKNSIILGLEDFESADVKRPVSAVRNIYAGILLLFKEKLLRLSPAGSDEVLIKARIIPSLNAAGVLIFRGEGDRTVDYFGIKERFGSLGVEVDWKRVERINKIRNNLEHYYSLENKDVVKGLISESLIVIRDFLTLHLGIDPQEFLGKEAWKVMLSTAEVFQKEETDCRAKLSKIDWKPGHLANAVQESSCLRCESTLIFPIPENVDRWDTAYKCRVCGFVQDFESFVERALGEYFQYDNYSSVKDGGEPATIMCPNCSKDTYILEDAFCPLCEESFKHTCQLCDIPIPYSEIDGSGYCGYCSYKLAKDD